MRRATVIIIATSFAVGCSLTLLSYWRRGDAARKVTRDGLAQRPLDSSKPPEPSLYGQISLKDRTREEAIKAWSDRRKGDKFADWKVAIDFHGRVLDEQNRPVNGAEINFEWTDLSERGTSHAHALTDERGNFSLKGVSGKNLGVSVSKDGYYTPRKSRMAGFEFADPGERTYYQADAQNPVIFRLRKQGKGLHLDGKSLDLTVPPDGTATCVELVSGVFAASNSLCIQSWKPWPSRPMSPAYDWKIILTIKNGGFVETNEEFPFEAPESGYSNSFTVDMLARMGSSWSISTEKTLYFFLADQRLYGCIKFRTSGNSRHVFVEYSLNATGSRDLETNPNIGLP